MGIVCANGGREKEREEKREVLRVGCAYLIDEEAKKQKTKNAFRYFCFSHLQKAWLLPLSSLSSSLFSENTLVLFGLILLFFVVGG